MRHIFFALLLACTLLTGTITAHASNQVGIIATVGDQAISSSDIEDRMRLAIFASGLTDSPEIRTKLFPQILQVLIDEELYRKEAVSLKLEVSDTEMARAVENLEQQNKLEKGKLTEFLDQHGVPFRALKRQIEAEILWQKIVVGKIRPKVLITDKEVDEGVEYINQHKAGAAEVNLSEITLPVNTPSDEPSVAELAKRLVTEIRQGTDFASVARQFSRSTTAASGGALGWIPQHQLAPEIQEAIRPLHVGDITDPIRAPEGYHILKLEDNRSEISADNNDTEYGIRQAFIPITATLSQSAQDRIIQTINNKKNKVKTCQDFETFSSDIHSSISANMVTVSLKQLNLKIAQTLSQTEIGHLTPLIQSKSGIHIFMVCEKTEAQASLEVRNKIRDALYRQKLELGVRRYLQDLKRSSFIEIRKS